MGQYLLALYRDYGVRVVPERSEQVWAGVNALGEELVAAGAFVFKGGMQGGPESATVVRQSGGEFVLVDGPYAETKEHLAGFWIVEAADLDAALGWAKLAAVAEQRAIEVRPLFGGGLEEAMEAGSADAG